MKTLLKLLKWTLSRGTDPQNFLGAAWIPLFLSAVPGRSKRRWALRILSMSPHYFIKPDLPKFRRMGFDEYLESSAGDIAASREELYRNVFRNALSDASTVLDFGCGPGFLAAAADRDGKKVHAVDISRGALACARILNGSERIVYALADDAGLDGISDGGVDAVVSLAVVQHLTEDSLDRYLSVCARKLRDGGVLALHIQSGNDVWRSEQDWRDDRTLGGRVKFNLGLHCFGRSVESYLEKLASVGFSDARAVKLVDLGLSDPDNRDTEHLVTAVRRRAGTPSGL
jgi:2-polyprenyl-3-methyl-5-hydroxy-6-metoxy-1,4-benzoquinol methylase